MGARLYQLVPTQREFLSLPGVGHNDVAAHASEIARRVSPRWWPAAPAAPFRARCERAQARRGQLSLRT